MPPIVRPSKSNSKTDLDKKNLEVRERLEDRLNRLNALWEQVEEKLIALQTPRHVSTVYDAQTNPESGESCHSWLALAKIGGNWRLCHYIHYDDDPYDPDWKPITDCSAEIRVEAAQHVSKLKEEIIRTAEEFLPKIDNAIASLDKALADIKKPTNENNPQDNKWSAIPLSDLLGLFERGPNWTVTLKNVPNTANREHDAVVLLTYAIQAFHNILEPRTHGGLLKDSTWDHPATASQLIESAKKSGLNFDRLDRVIQDPNNRGNYIAWGGGSKKGITYTLTQPGRERATDLIQVLLEDLEHRA